MRFDWDADKAEENRWKHEGVTFDEAVEVFYDATAFEEYDDEHSNAEEIRFVRIGNSSKRLLRVSFTIRQDKSDNEIIRIISAQKGKVKEVKKYNEQNR